MPLLVQEQVIVDLQAGRDVESNGEIIYRAYRLRVIANCMRAGISEAESEDLAQEVFLAAFASIKSIAQSG